MGLEVQSVRAHVRSLDELELVLPHASRWARLEGVPLAISVAASGHGAELWRAERELAPRIRHMVRALGPETCPPPAVVPADASDAWRSRAGELLVLPHPRLNRPTSRWALAAIRRMAGPLLFACRAAPVPRVLAASDLSDPAYPALGSGWQAARYLQANLTALHCVPWIDDLLALAPLAPFDIPPQWATRGSLEASRRRLEQALDALGIAHEAEARVLDQPPVAAILRAAAEERAQLLVVGKHTRGPIERLLFGSVPETVVRRATCPVMVVPLAAG